LVKFTDTAKAVVVVHLAGYPAEMDTFMKLADRYGLWTRRRVSAPSIGLRAGSVGHISALSFYATNRGRERRVSSRLFSGLSTAVPAL